LQLAVTEACIPHRRISVVHKLFLFELRAT